MRDVVVLRAGEVLQQVPVRLGRDDAEVVAQAVVRDDRRLRVALRRDLDDPRERAERVESARASVAVAIRSRSRTVSRKRRAEPAIETAPPPDAPRPRPRPRAASAACSRAARGAAPRPPSASRARRGSAPRASPRCPATLRSSCASAAARRSATVVIPSSCHSRRAVFGPSPGSRMNVATSGGTSDLRLVSASTSPVSIAWTIFSSMVLPIPCSSFARPSSASWATELDVSRIRAAALPVGADAEGVAPLDLHQVGQEIELRGQFRSSSGAPAPRRR